MKRIEFGKKAAWSLASLSCILVMAASAHFIYLASATQPECVTHKKPGLASGQGYSAAKSSC